MSFRVWPLRRMGLVTAGVSGCGNRSGSALGRTAPRGGLALLAMLVLLSAGCTSVAPRPPEIAARAGALTPREATNLRVFDAVWDLVNRKFHDSKFGGVDWNAAALTHMSGALRATNDDELYGVLNTMLRELKETHVWAMTPQQLKARREAERHPAPRALLGLGLGWIEERWVVLRVLAGSPAEEAGVKRGWLLVTRNGQPLDGTDNFTAKEGETVIEGFLDQHDQLHTLSITPRSILPPPPREVRELEGGILLLRFDEFDWTSRSWLREQLKTHRSVPAVVVDLRSNRGGDAISLGFAIGEFFSKSVDWGRFSLRNGWQFNAPSWPWGSARYAGRVVVLTGGSTASSAEIFAHALQHHRRAVLVGGPTAGAVVPSFFYSLPGGGELQLGTFNYHGLDGQRLEGAGVKPDVTVTPTLAALRTGQDLEIEAALEELRKPAPQLNGR